MLITRLTRLLLAAPLSVGALIAAGPAQAIPFLSNDAHRSKLA